MFEKKEYVLTVYEEQSFTKAAEKLYISQPCLSAAIRKIEQEIGMPLFERRHSSLRPTEVGEFYLTAAKNIRHQEQEFLMRRDDLRRLETGNLILGGSGNITSYFLPPIVNRFTQRYPKINISLVESNSADLEQKLQAEDLDLLIDSYDEEKDGFDWHPLLEEKILLAVPANRPCNRGLEAYRITPEEIFLRKKDTNSLPPLPLTPFASEPFILLQSGNSMRRHAKTVFQAANFTPNIAFTLHQLVTSYALAASDNGLCFVTDTMFRFHRFRDEVFLYNIEQSGTRTLYLLQKHSRYTTTAMEKFIQTAKEILT